MKGWHALLIILVVVGGVVAFLFVRRARAAADTGNQLAGSIAAATPIGAVAQIEAAVPIGPKAAKNPLLGLPALGKGTTAVTGKNRKGVFTPTAKPAPITPAGVVAAIEAERFNAEKSVTTGAGAFGASPNGAQPLPTVGAGKVASVQSSLLGNAAKKITGVAKTPLGSVAVNLVPGGSQVVAAAAVAKPLVGVAKPIVNVGSSVALKAQSISLAPAKLATNAVAAGANKVLPKAVAKPVATAVKAPVKVAAKVTAAPVKALKKLF